MRRHAAWALPALLLAAVPAPAAEKEPMPQEVRFFETKVRPLLADNCFSCHGEKKQKGGLRLDSRAALLAGGDRGPAVEPGLPDKSLLVSAVRYEHEKVKMPPRQKLTDQQIADLVEWVRMGAPWPGGDKADTSTVRRGEFKITDKDRAHWAFQPVTRPAIPDVKDPAWVANPIDAFVLARLEAKGLRPNAPAERRALVRRVTHDVTGLPPTPAEVEAFVNDPSPRAYEQLVDRLLASPRYGEKWGRHWLDLVRFAETNSYERDGPKPHAWRYRDYVIRSLNADKPYDRFVQEQLAGDELPDGGADGLIATGYYRLGIWDDEPTDALQARYDGLDDLVATTGQVFLGLTFDCARCHDHKLDPIPQKDYYRLLSFFQNVNHFKNGGPTDEQPLPDEPGRARKGPPGMALCVTEAGPTAPETFVLQRGNAHVRGDKVEPAFPEILGGGQLVPAAQPPGAKTCLRRKTLADWIISKDNRLASRVIANRVWQYHFGRGIVRSPNNFGEQGDAPTHPELLDWLASELVDSGWHLKALHRLILTSNAYRMSSQGNSEALAADPANDLLWRFDVRRLTAEEIRDSLLAVNGTLNLKMAGPGVYVDIPKEVLAGQSMPGHGWGKSPPEEQARRSVYIHVKRSLLTPLLETFDYPETDRSSPARFATTQPTQALGMMNGEFLHKQAALFAERLRREAGDDVEKQVRLALNLATARPATDVEAQRGMKLIAALRARDGATPETALRLYCLLVLNLNEFLYLD
jgi:mono/diheme cytochrome c family protein